MIAAGTPPRVTAPNANQNAAGNDQNFQEVDLGDIANATTHGFFADILHGLADRVSRKRTPSFREGDMNIQDSPQGKIIQTVGNPRVQIIASSPEQQQQRSSSINCQKLLARNNNVIFSRIFRLLARRCRR